MEVIMSSVNREFYFFFPSLCALISLSCLIALAITSSTMVKWCGKSGHVGVPIVVQRKWIRLGTVQLQVRSLALLSGLRIRRCRELWYTLQTRLESHVASSYSSNSTPSLGTSICHGFGPRNGRKTKKIKNMHSWFTMLCKFLLYSKGTQSYIYVYYFPSWSIPGDWI